MLPLALHNFLRISPVNPFSSSVCQQWLIPYNLTKAVIANPGYYQKFFHGLGASGREFSGQIELQGEKCNLWLKNEEGKLNVEVEVE